MQFNDFYLKFQSKEQADEILFTEVPVAFDEDGKPTEFFKKQNFMNTDILGTLYQKFPDEVPEDYEPVALDGWHVNVRAMPDEDTSALEEFKVNPEPVAWRRTWA